MQPRLIASYGEPGIVYQYSGRDNVAMPWTPTLLEIKSKIEAVQREYNYCLLNRYRTGQDSMGMHADDEPEMGKVIGSLSLGAIRTFRIRHNETKEEHVSSRQRYAHHHGWNHAAFLEARSSKVERGRGRENQFVVREDRDAEPPLKSAINDSERSAPISISSVDRGSP
jgi:hypothetical protein